MLNKLSPDSMKFICLQKLKPLLVNQKCLTKCQILDVVADVVDEFDRFF